MLRWFRLRKVHELYLESSRNLDEGRRYWEQAKGCRLAFLSAITPIPIMGLHDEGKLLLEALQWLEANATATRLTEQVLQKYHKFLFPKHGAGGGEYRKGGVTIKGSKVPRPHSNKIQALMSQLEQKLDQEQTRLDETHPASLADVIRVSAAIHQRLAFIHPFQDGNGRVARLAMNHILRRYGQGYSIIPPISESPDHFNTLEEAHKGNPDVFVEFVGKYVYSV